MGDSSTPKRRRLVLALASLAAIGVAIFFILQRTLWQPANIDIALGHCVGERLAAEALRLAGDNGTVVAYTDAGKQYGTEAGNAQLAAFQAAVAKQGNCKLVIVPPADYATYTRVTELQGLPAEVVTELFQRHSQASVIVSFVGVPRCALPGERPAVKLIALDTSGTANWGDWLERDGLSAVIFSREGPAATRGSDCAKLFDAWFAVVTKANAHEFSH